MLMAIDPGKNGALVWAGMDEGATCCERMPATDGDCVEVLRSLSSCEGSGAKRVCYIEKVGGFVKGKSAPGSAMFNFGHGRGVLVGALMAFGWRVVQVTPQKWQAWLGIGKVGGDKNKLKAEAQRRFPDQDVTLANADALLIFDYARSMEK